MTQHNTNVAFSVNPELDAAIGLGLKYEDMSPEKRRVLQHLCHPQGISPDADDLIGELAARCESADPNIEELVGAIWRQFGGAKGIAEALHKDYKAAPEGSQTRVRVMSDVTRLIHTCFDGRGGGEDGDLEAMEAELKALVRQED
ncbi:hypothetical protein LCGC14_1489650 [marine sediment metagenome]|uniref:Uncharacterized protein n=1 Tax=marine sediment metagenome TaxID=412755 RepID=A0A0F9LMJ8_9ZZZZ|nr:hypothetical protein [Phycisphaerae bacterium]HDZ44263.1 hypothetical protein [Phycisphaerae bacterium]